MLSKKINIYYLKKIIIKIKNKFSLLYMPTILQPFYQKKKKNNSLTQIQTQTQSQTQTQTQIHIHNYSSTLSSSAIGSKIFIISRNAMVRYDMWSGTVVAKSSILFRRKKFTTAVVSGKI